MEIKVWIQVLQRKDWTDSCKYIFFNSKDFRDIENVQKQNVLKVMSIEMYLATDAVIYKGCIKG